MEAVAPKRYRARFIEPGVISYEDVGQGVCLVTREFLDKIRPSFVGKPVFVMHNDEDPIRAFNFDSKDGEKADGIVSMVDTDSDGWDWADMLVWDKEAQSKLDSGWGISCAYDIEKYRDGGTYNSVPYDEEPIDGAYVHMAIVPNPRYSDSTVRANSKGGETVKKNGWFFVKKNAEPTEEDKKKAAEEKAKVEAAKKNGEGGEPDGDEGYVVIEGQQVPMSDLIEAYMQGNQNAEEVTPETEVQLPNGQTAKVGDMVKAYQARKGSMAENAEVEDPGTEADGDVVDNTKRNSQGREAPNENFNIVRKNAQQVVLEKPNIRTRSDRLAEGKSRYGTAVAVKAGE